MSRKSKSLFRHILYSLAILSFLAQPMCTMATEIKSNASSNDVQYMDMIINPEYADVLDVESLRAEQEEIKVGVNIADFIAFANAKNIVDITSIDYIEFSRSSTACLDSTQDDIEM